MVRFESQGYEDKPEESGADSSHELLPVLPSAEERASAEMAVAIIKNIVEAVTDPDVQKGSQHTSVYFALDQNVHVGAHDIMLAQLRESPLWKGDLPAPSFEEEMNDTARRVPVLTGVGQIGDCYLWRSFVRYRISAPELDANPKHHTVKLPPELDGQAYAVIYRVTSINSKV